MKGYHDTKTPESIRDLWRTPKEIFDYYNKRFCFTLDLAASDENHLCDNYITSEMDALNYATVDEVIDTMGYEFQQEGVAWCNPPYSNCKVWVGAAIEYSQIFKMKVVMLLPADTSVQWFKTAFDNCTECHLISGRLSFINEESGKPVSGNNKGSVVFVFDPNSPVKSQTVLLSRDEIMGK